MEMPCRRRAAGNADRLAGARGFWKPDVRAGDLENKKAAALIGRGLFEAGL
jgi:hypothetical protein